MKKNILLFFIIFSIISSTFAQKKAKLINVKGKHQELIDDSHCIGDIKRKVEDYAKIKAIEEVFGRVIVQGTNTYIENIETGERVETTSQMNMIANSLVRGEWIETTKVKTEWVLQNNNGKQELWLNCEVWGKAREIQEAQTNFIAKTLKCQDLENCITERFKNNEELFLYFKSPIEGYLNVYLEESGQVYRLFPYRQMTGEYESHVPMKADKEYLLFSMKQGRDYFANSSIREIDEYTLNTGSKDLLFNRLYIVFSTQAFKKPVFKEQNNMKITSPKEFQAWIANNKALNKEFQVNSIDIVVNKE